MKNKLLYILLLITANGFSQDITLEPPYQSTDYFINGISLPGTFTTTNAAGYDSVVYLFPDGSTQTSTDEANDFPVQYDLGLIMNMNTISAELWSGGASEPAANSLSFPNAINKPKWLEINSVNASVVNVAYPNMTISASLDFITALFNAGSSENDIPGISGKSFGLSNCGFQLNIVHNLEDNSNTASSPNVGVGFDFMGRQNFTYNVPIASTASLAPSAAFELAVTVEDSITPNPFKFNFPKFRFAAGPVPVTIDGGIELQAQVKGKVYAGYNNANSSWGFLDDGGTANTRLLAKLKGSGTLRVTAEAGVAAAWGSLTLAGSIGGGLKYGSFNTPQTEALFGYTLSLYGTVGYRLGPPCFTNWFTGNEICLNKEGTLEKEFWGNTSSGWSNVRSANQESIFENIDAKGIYESESRSNLSLVVPDFFAQPTFAQRDTHLVVVWLDYVDSLTFLKLSNLSYTENSFGDEVIIHSSPSSITSPKVALLKDGSALITWTQSRYTSSADSSEVTLENILESQDIYVSLYDKQSSNISAPAKVDDGLVTSDTSGRAEGNSKITLNVDSSGLITWTVGNLNDQVYSIWYATVSDSNGVVSIGQPSLLSDAGTSSDKNVRVSYTDTVNAIAVWIHDEDGIDSTLDQSIVFKKWDGNNWDSDQTELISSGADEKIEDLSLDFTGDYGALAYISTVYDETRMTFVKKIVAEAWNSSTDLFTSTPFEDTDTMFYFQNPRITVSNNGIATLIYQANELYDDGDTNTAPQSYLYLLVKDLNEPGSTWKEIEADGTIADSSVYAWDIDASFAGGEDLLVISQEASNDDGNAPLDPSNGVRFGDYKLNLVLRAATFNNNLDVTPATEPTGNIINSIPRFVDEESPVIKVYPNPVTNQLFFNTAGVRIEAIKIYDALGVLVSQHILPISDNIDVSDFNNGVYVAEINVKGSTVVRRWVKM